MVSRKEHSEGMIDEGIDFDFSRGRHELTNPVNGPRGHFPNSCCYNCIQTADNIDPSMVADSLHMQHHETQRAYGSLFGWTFGAPDLIPLSLHSVLEKVSGQTDESVKPSRSPWGR